MKTEAHYYKFYYLPGNLDVERHIALHSAGRKVKLNTLKYILSILVMRTYQKIYKRGANLDVPLSSKILKKVDSNYNHSMNYLIEHDLIERSKSYQVKHRCKRVRLKWKFNEIKQEKIPKKRLQGQLLITDNSNKYDLPTYLVKHFNQKMTIASMMLTIGKC